jgi:hypothetical protein
MLSLRDGDHTAVQRLWDRYFQPLVCVARGRLKGAPRCLSEADQGRLDEAIRHREETVRLLSSGDPGKRKKFVCRLGTGGHITGGEARTIGR